MSFETNYDFRGDLTELVNAVVERFQPRAFDVLIFMPDAEAKLHVEGLSR